MAFKQVEMGVTASICGRVGTQVWKKGTPNEQHVMRVSILGSEFIINMDMADPNHAKAFGYVNANPNCEMQIKARVEGNGDYCRYYYQSAEVVQLKLAKADVDEAAAKAIFG
jgi:hypothetical protein